MLIHNVADSSHTSSAPTLFRYNPYIPWDIWLAKSRFHEYAWGSRDQSSSNKIACYNKILGDFHTKIESVEKYGWDKAHDQLPG